MRTPIHVARLKGKAKEFLICADKFTPYAVKHIYATKDIFDQLLQSISPSIRNNYIDDIPFNDKIIIPLK